MMTIEEFKKIPDRHRLIFIANLRERYEEVDMRDWWERSEDRFRYPDKPYWKRLRVGRDYMVDVWNEVCDNHPHPNHLRRSKESSYD